MTTFTSHLEIPHLDQNVAQPEIPENEAKDIIDAGIAGQLTLTMADADYTLKDTNANGTLSYPFEWQHSTIIVDIANTASRTIFVPIGKQMVYIVHNNSTGYNLVLSQDGDTETIPNNSIYKLVCTGSNIWRVL